MAIKHLDLFMRVDLAELGMELVDDSIAIEEESEIELQPLEGLTCFVAKVESWQLWSGELPHANHDEQSWEKLLLQGPTDSSETSYAKGSSKEHNY